MPPTGDEWDTADSGLRGLLGRGDAGQARLLPNGGLKERANRYLARPDQMWDWSARPWRDGGRGVWRTC